MEQWSDEEVFDLRAMLARLAARRWWIVASVVLWTALFVAIALLMTPVYRSSTVLVPADTARSGDALGSALGQLGGLASLAGINVGSAGQATEEALAVLRSRQLTEAFIRDLGLMPKLFPKKWDASTNTWRADVENPPTAAKAYKLFNEKIRTVASDKKSGLVTVHINWTDREEAARWANDLVRRLNEEMRRRAIEQANASVGYLEREYDSTTNVSTRTAIARLIETQIRQRMLANVTQEYAFRVVDPALPADPGDPVKPNKLVLFALGPLVGLLLGALLVLVYDWWRREPAHTADAARAPSLA